MFKESSDVAWALEAGDDQVMDDFFWEGRAFSSPLSIQNPVPFATSENLNRIMFIAIVYVEMLKFEDGHPQCSLCRS